MNLIRIMPAAGPRTGTMPGPRILRLPRGRGAMRRPVLPAAAILITAPLTLTIAWPAMAQDKPVLTVYTYSSFVSEWGPGPAVEKAFEIGRASCRERVCQYV